MAAVEIHSPHDAVHSDYGPDFDSEEEAILTELITLAELESTGAFGAFELESLDEDDAPTSSSLNIPKPFADVPTAPVEASHNHRHHHQHPHNAATANLSRAGDASVCSVPPRRDPDIPYVEVEYSELSRVSWTTNNRRLVRSESTVAAVEDASKTTQSPLQRFRTAPKKPLSVTDLVSPAWCELQYWYTLTKHGRKKRTPAMKQGTAIHRTLEEQVHAIVDIQVTTKEDRLGLRIWNTIQGLRELKSMGLTRELVVWGLVGGQVVNGVIDEVSYTRPTLNPDTDQFDGQFIALNASTNSQQNVSFPVPWLTGGDSDSSDGTSSPRTKIYLTDVKTRRSNILPTESSMRGTHMQLMLYHKMLSDLAANQVDPNEIFMRYDLDPNAVFSDSFIAQIVGREPDYPLSQDSSFGSSDSEEFVPDVLSHNTVAKLWQLMIEELGQIITGGDSISEMLRVEFRLDAETIIGNKLFSYNNDTLNRYIEDGMRWWKGEREARGVDIEESFKCNYCDFAKECTWKKTKIDEPIEKTRIKAKSRKSTV